MITMRLRYKEMNELLGNQNIDFTACDAEKLDEGTYWLKFCFIDNFSADYTKIENGLVVEAINPQHGIGTALLSKTEYAKLKMLHMSDRTRNFFE